MKQNVSIKAGFLKLVFYFPCFSFLSSPDTRRRFLHFVLPLDYLEAWCMVFTAKLLNCKRSTFSWDSYHFDGSYLLILFNYVGMVLTLTVEAETLLMHWQKLVQLSSPLCDGGHIPLLLRIHTVFAETQAQACKALQLCLWTVKRFTGATCISLIMCLNALLVWGF